MNNEKEGYEYVLTQVDPKVTELYRYYQNRDSTLEDKEGTMEKLEILVEKKYISNTYISELMYIVDAYNRKMHGEYITHLFDYINRIVAFLDYNT